MRGMHQGWVLNQVPKITVDQGFDISQPISSSSIMLGHIKHQIECAVSLQAVSPQAVRS